MHTTLLPNATTADTTITAMITINRLINDAFTAEFPTINRFAAFRWGGDIVLEIAWDVDSLDCRFSSVRRPSLFIACLSNSRAFQ